MHTSKPLILLTLLGVAGSALAADCEVASAPTRTPLIELFTSEGCSSCPPADRWLSQFTQSNKAVALAFHVDYWDYIGWKDRFAEPRNSQRQRDWAQQTGARTIYTPQVLVNGKDARAWRGIDPLAGVAADTPARADIHLSASRTATGTTVTATASAPNAADTQLVVARYENGHESKVQAGENRGATLHHDFVVRDWEARPLPPHDTLKAQWTFLPAERAGGVAAFVENTRTGEILQAVALPDCAP